VVGLEVAGLDLVVFEFPTCVDDGVEQVPDLPSQGRTSLSVNF
jgi:hypothetical protein